MEWRRAAMLAHVAFVCQNSNMNPLLLLFSGIRLYLRERESVVSIPPDSKSTVRYKKVETKIIASTDLNPS